MAAENRKAQQFPGGENLAIAAVLQRFYEAPAGKQLAEDLRSFLGEAWPEGDLGSGHLMWLGYPPPGIERIARTAKSFSLLTPPFIGPLPWVDGGFNKSAVADPARFPLRESSFDFAVVSHVFEYLDDPLSFVEELWRALVPGGRAVFLLPTGRWPWGAAASGFGRAARAVSKGTFSSFLKENGFLPIRTAGCLYGFPWGFPGRPTMASAIKKLTRGRSLALAGFYVLEAEKRLGGEAVEAKRAPLRTAPANPVTS